MCPEAAALDCLLGMLPGRKQWGQAWVKGMEQQWANSSQTGQGSAMKSCPAAIQSFALVSFTWLSLRNLGDVCFQIWGLLPVVCFMVIQWATAFMPLLPASPTGLIIPLFHPFFLAGSSWCAPLQRYHLLSVPHYSENFVCFCRPCLVGC